MMLSERCTRRRGGRLGRSLALPGRSLALPGRSLALPTVVLIGLVGITAGGRVAGGAEPPKAGENRPRVPHIVFVTGDEEYRSEESMPMLAKILHRDYGFKVTVCYALGKDGTIDTNNLENIAGLDAVDDADLLVTFTRFRKLPDDQLR